MDRRSLALLCDYYEITMSNGYFDLGMRDQIAYFDVFFRNNPEGGGYSVASGIEQIARYVKELRFSESDMEYLRGRGVFSDEFLAYLETFSFTGDILAVPEGTVVFPYEPIMIVRAPVIEAQLIETYVLLQINHQSLIATKASRIVRAAEGRPVFEFGSRRAHGEDAALLGARAAYIGGCSGTACVLADKKFGIPAGGTMAHSWVQMFDSEYLAFKAYCTLYPDNPTLLVDTYNVLGSGVPSAIRAIKDVLIPQGKRRCSVRIDSGDITYLTKKVRKMLDDAGLDECRITVSNSLDEHIITEIIRQGAKVDSFGVGERLITAAADPVFGAVYKLAATERDGVITPKIKVSENIEKITNPHFKKVVRIYSKETGKAEADLICLFDEEIPEDRPLEIFDPHYTWKRKTFEDFTLRELLVPVIKNGETVCDFPPVDKVREYCASEIGSMWDEVLRFENPHNYYVDLSERLWSLKGRMIEDRRC